VLAYQAEIIDDHGRHHLPSFDGFQSTARASDPPGPVHELGSAVQPRPLPATGVHAPPRHLRRRRSWPH
jgi:hypothetical protein